MSVIFGQLVFGVGTESIHSKVFLAPLTFPSSAPEPSVRGAVAVKLSNPCDDARREMLLNEGRSAPARSTGG